MTARPSPALGAPAAVVPVPLGREGNASLVRLTAAATVAAADVAVRWALVAFAVLGCAAMLWWPLGYDQAVFAFVGDIVARGGLPYRDASELRGPLAFYVSAAFQLVFGQHAWGVRVVDVLFAAVTSGLLYRGLRDRTSPAVALTAAAVWPLVVASQGYPDSAQFDLWVGTLVLIAVSRVARAGGYRRRDLVVAGALVGLASLTKPFYPALLAVPGIVVVLRHRTDRRFDLRAGARDLAVLTAAWFAPIAIMAVWLWSQGVLGEAWNTHIGFALHGYAGHTEYSRFPGHSWLGLFVRGVLDYVQQPKVVVALAPVATGLVVLWTRERALAAAVTAWVAAGLLFVVMQNKFWAYHWTPFYPALVLLGAVGLHAAGARARAAGDAASRVLAYVAGVAAVAMLAVGPAHEVRTWLSYMLGRQSRTAYYEQFTSPAEASAAEQQQIAEYLRAHTRPGDAFVNWTSSSGLSFLAGRPGVSRYANKSLFVYVQGPFVQTALREYMAAVRRERPAYVVVNMRGPTQYASSRALLERENPELAAIVTAEYVLEKNTGSTDLYRRKAFAAPAPSPAHPPVP